MSNKAFIADSIYIGFCKRPECRAIHFQLLDHAGEVRAQAVIACENVDQVSNDMKQIRDRVLGTHTSVGLH